MIPTQTLRSLALAAALVAAGSAQATLTVSAATSADSFATLVGSSVDTLSDLQINSEVVSPMVRTYGGLGMTVSADNGLFVVPIAGAVGLSTYGSSYDSITIGSFSAPVFAFGASVFGTNVLGEVTSGGVTLTAYDVNGDSLSTTLTGNSATAFAGFTSTVALSHVVLSMTTPNDSVYVSMDNLVSAVPEPGTWGLMLAGSLLLGTRVRRRG